MSEPRRPGICLCALALLSAVVSGQETLTLDKALQTALANHPSLQAARYELDAAAAHARGARALANPEIRITPNVLGPAKSDELISVVQPLELNGSRRARAEVAAGQKEAVAARAALTERDLVLNVTRSYWEAVLAQIVVTVDSENVRQAQTSAELAALEVQLGNQPQTQALKADVELARARQQLYRSQASAVQARAKLNAAMGLPPASELALPGELPFAATTLAEPRLQLLALSRRADLAQARANLRTAQGELAAARAVGRPDVALQYEADQDGEGGVGVSLTLPQPDWGALKAGRRKAAVSLLASQKTVAAVENDIRLQVSTAAAGLRSAEAQVHEYQQGVLEQSQRLADMSLLGYKEGAASLLDVLEARRTLRAVNLEYYSALADHLKSRAELQWAIGGSLPPESVARPSAPAAKAPPVPAIKPVEVK